MTTSKSFGGVSTLGVVCLSVFVLTFAVAVKYSPSDSLVSSLVLALVLAYLPSYFDGSEYTGDRYWEWFAHLTWPNSDVDMQIIYDSPLEASKQCIFTSHPHGVMSVHHGMLLSGTSTPPFRESIPGACRRHLAAPVCFRIPIYREVLLWLGCVNSSKNYAVKVLREKKSLFILVGGVIEQLLAQQGEQSVYIKNRKGFVKLALQYGAAIVPSYNFGETELFSASSLLLPLRQKIAKKFNFAALIACGPRWYFPFQPHPMKTYQVFGKPIEVQKVENPTPEQINEVHDQYIAEVDRIFKKYKKQCGFEDAKLKLH